MSAATDASAAPALKRARAPALRLRGITGVWWRHAVALARVWKVAFTWFFVYYSFVLLVM